MNKPRHTRFRLRTPDGTLLAVQQIWPKKSPYAVIFVHALTGDMAGETVQTKIISALTELGIATVRFDMRAHGESNSGDKPFSVSTALEDLTTVFDYVKSKKPVYIGLVGASFGGSIASLYAGLHPGSISALCLHNPVLHYAESYLNPNTPWSLRYFGSWEKDLEKYGHVSLKNGTFKLGPEFFTELKTYQPFTLLQEYHGPLLFLHGTNDTKVSYFETKRLFDLLSNRQKQFIPIEDAEHGFFEEPHTSKVIKRTVDFFKDSWVIVR